MFVTEKLLKTLKACEDQRDRFAELFPQGVELARELIVQHAQEFDWWWCAENLASAGGWAAYRRTEKQAWNVYQRAIKTALAAYDPSAESAEAAYQQAMEQAEAVYNLACATAFADVMGL